MSDAELIAALKAQVHRCKSALRGLIALDDRFRDEDYDERISFTGAYYTYYKGADDKWKAAREAVSKGIQP